MDLLRNVNKYAIGLIKELFSCFPLENKQLLLTVYNYSIMILCLEWKIGKFENVRIFKHYRMLIIEGKKERNHYDLKEIENIKIARIA